MTSLAAVPLIVHVVHRFDYGGLENGIVNLINTIPRDRYRHAVICLTTYSADFASRIERQDVPLIALEKRAGNDARTYFRFWRAVRRLRPAIVHTRNFGTIDMQWVAWAARVKYRVHSEHGWDAADLHGQRTQSLLVRRACRPVIRRYVAMSKDIARWLADDVGVPRDLISQLYSGVDSRRFFPRSGTSDVASGSAIVVGTVGRLDPVKNQAALLRAVRVVLDRSPEIGRNVRLVIVGEGPAREQLETVAQELRLGDRVWFTGARNDVPDLMRSMDVFVLPSLNEGISNTILEAMACGLPVIAGRVGGNPEVMVDGRTGRLIEVDDQSDFADALGAYLSDPERRQLDGAAGRQRVIKEFSLDAMVRRYLTLYDEVTCGDSLGMDGRTASGRSGH